MPFKITIMRQLFTKIAMLPEMLSALRPVLLSVASAAVLVSGCADSSSYRKIEGFAQGGTYHITYSTKTPAGDTIAVSEDSLGKRISEILKNIDYSFSGYNKSSLLSKVNEGENVELDDMFIELFETSKIISKETEGYFDISGAPLYDFWGFGFKDSDKMTEMQDNVETQTIIDSLLDFVGMENVRIEGRRLVKSDPRVKLNFNAIAQGYTCDKIAELLEDCGIGDYLVEVGGEIMCKGRNASGRLWRIGIDKPIDGNEKAGENIEEIINVTDCGIVTSGNYRKFYIVNGRKYAHSIDPHTGYPVQHNLLSATIIAENATIADAYATYCMVVGKEKAIEFIKLHDGIRGYLICADEIINLLD